MDREKLFFLCYNRYVLNIVVVQHKGGIWVFVFCRLNRLSIHERRLTARGRMERKIKVEGWKVGEDRRDIS